MSQLKAQKSTMQPANALFQDELQPIALPVCDHYAGSEKLMQKSMILQKESSTLFDITFDCEDGAAVENEAQQAQLIVNLIESSANQFKRIGARIHEPNSPFFKQDIEQICRATQLAYIVIPKINHAEQLKDAIKAIQRQRDIYSLPPLPIHVLIETHGALADVRLIAAMPDVACLSFGIMDFVSAHYGAIPANAMRTPLQFTHPLIVRAKLEIAAACHQFGKVASHNVTTEFKDTATVANDAQRACNEFGFNRMWSIHPDQIKPILLAFSPRISEIHEACSILHAAKAVSWGPIQLQGRLHDRASYRYYWTVLNRAKTTGIALPENALELL